MQRAALQAGSLGLGCVVVHCADRVPTAFHEAGHAIVAEHISEEGLVCDTSGDSARFSPAGGQGSSLLRYVTITPRVTEKGQTYAGETKLAVRWRHMHDHLAWSADTDVAARVPTLQSGTVCAAVRDAQRQVAVVGLARIAWLFGGNAAEQRLVAWLWAPSPATASERVESLRSSPAMARGDLRKARQVAHETLPPEVESAAFEAAYRYADSILAARWPHVCALSGALLARGALDGSELRCLLRQQHGDASTPSPEVREEGWPRHGRLLRLTAGLCHPFVFGCVWGFVTPSMRTASAEAS